MGGGGFAQAGTPPLSFRFFLKCKSEAIDLAQGETIVSFQHVSMQFPGVLANHDVTLDIRKGEVFALVGENGAGKSTLMNILYGLNTPTSGKVLVKGSQVTHFSPSEAIARGVGMVHQHFMLVPSFTVAQNIVLSNEPRKLGIFCDFAKAEEETQALVQEYGLTVDPRAKVEDISVGLQQRVEILKTLRRGADVLILDEPTAVLTPQETDELFGVIRRMVREKQMTIIIITHKLYEVMAISDRVGVMRQGKLVGVAETKDVNERILAAMMVGKEVLLDALDREDRGETETAVEVRDLQALDNRGLPAVRGVSLTVRRGEILGIAGIEGNGQSELIEAITGMRPLRGGTVTIMGKSIAGKTPGEIRALGLAHVPEDRLATGVCAPADITDNLIVGKEKDPRFSWKRIHMKRKAIRAYAQEIFQRFDIRGAGVDTAVGSLSGGNMQKVVVAREFSFDTPVLIISQPTRGVDIGAMDFIHQQIMQKRNAGCAILLVSADLDELLRLSDRLLTIYEGRITGEFQAGDIDKREISYYMTGGRKEEQA
ncbi:MAG TPA: ABC transporter ATP-binding protein [Candidatus Egerieenecus merdigallinarum]|nr:ABC transporter ATP-binding protein [Candidatus Egerieenecus merdigallinarum]